MAKVEKAVATTGRGAEGLERARALLAEVKTAIERRDLPGVKEQLEKLSRAHHMLKVIASP